MNRIPFRLALVCGLLAVCSCGGGGSTGHSGAQQSGESRPGSGTGGLAPVGAELSSDVLLVNFPFEHAAFGFSDVTVSGLIDHRDSARFSVSVMVNDSVTSGTIDDAGYFAIPDVPLGTSDAGIPLEIVAEHPDLGVARKSLVLARSPDVGSLADIEMDDVRNRVVAVDRHGGSIVSIDLADGLREVVSGPLPGGGEDLSETVARVLFSGTGEQIAEPVALALDGANNLAYVLDEDERALFKVDLTSGEQSMLFKKGFGGRVAFNPGNGTVVLTDREDHGFRVIVFDPLTNTRSVIFDAGIGNGPGIPPAEGLAIDADLNRAILVDGNSDHLYAVSLWTGSMSVISRPANEAGAFNGFMWDIVMQDGTAYVVDISLGSVVKVDLATGQRTTLSDASVVSGGAIGDGRALELPRAIAYDSWYDRLVVADDVMDALIGIDPDSGDRTLLTHAGIGTGDSLVSPSGLAMTRDPIRLFAVDSQTGTGVEFDPNTGDRRRIFRADNGGNTFGGVPVTLAVDSTRNLLYYGDSSADAVYSVNVAGGEPVVVSDASHGSGPHFGAISDIELDPSRGVAYVLDLELDALLEVDLKTGDRRVVSDTQIGIGEMLRNPIGLELDLDDRRAFVADAGTNTILEINLLNGDRVAVSSEPLADGLLSVSLGDIAYDEPNERILALDPHRGSVYSIDLDTGWAVLVSGDASVSALGEDAEGRRQEIDVPRLIGGGTAFAQPQRIELDTDGMIAYVLDDGYDGLFAVNLHGGDRQLISK
ncbi:MAG: hypothetical protein OXJ56_04140 [Rhodospirillaceae bacterium]|nr:hypothetical protein [Rhodospirillaceae bacterium]